MSVIKIRDESGEFVDIPVIKGEKGEDGPSNVLTIGSVTSGDTASATITGESPNQVLNLVLPKGDTGAQGEQGLQGPPGKNGTDGVSITTGNTWEPIQQNGYTVTDTTFNLSDGNNITISIKAKNGQDGTNVSVIEATDEEDALTLSAQNPNNIYFWE